MIYRTILISLSIMFFSPQIFAEESLPVREFKKNPTAVKLLNLIKRDGRESHFTTVSLGGSCGVAGCSWSALVILESRDPPASSHSYSASVMAVVSGFSPGNDGVNVRFVKLEAVDESTVTKI